MDRETIRQVKQAFQASRTGAILRCAEILLDTGRKDLAKQVLQATQIDRNRLAALRKQSAKGIH